MPGVDTNNQSTSATTDELKQEILRSSPLKRRKTIVDKRLTQKSNLNSSRLIDNVV